MGGDIVFIETREREVYYTGGVLQGREIPLPRDYDLDVLAAISLAPVVDPAQDGIVVAVVKEGYVMDDEPLRVASVVVGRSG